jgi:predicted dehydrogenase
MNIGLVGIGHWGKNHLRILSGFRGVKLRYVCDSDRKRLLAFESNYSNIKFTEDFGELLSGVDAVVISSSAITHYHFAKQALLEGKHVFVEKPLALNPDEGEELLEVAESKRLILMVGHLLLFHPAVEMLKTLIIKRTLGEIYYLYSQRSNLGIVRQDENVLWSLAPHDIYIPLYLLGDVPESVSVRGKDYLQSGIEDVVFGNLFFSDGKMANFHTSWLDPRKVRRFTVVGSKKMAVFDDMESEEKLKIYDKGIDIQRAGKEELPPATVSVRYGDVISPSLPSKEPLAEELWHFISCVLEGKKPVADGRHGLLTLYILDACQRSLNSKGIPIEIPEKARRLLR